MVHREKGYKFLSGSGLEIGALHEPCVLPENCSVCYFDVVGREEAVRLFPTLDSELFVEVDVVGDIDKRDLRKLGESSQDYVIANHVIEHVANPIFMIEDLFHITKEGGVVYLSAPDKRYTYDRERELTTFEHLKSEYEEGVDYVTDEHYLDFLRHAGKHVFEDPNRDIQADIEFNRQRREHAHVWNTETFLAFLENCKALLSLDFDILYHSPGDENQIECLVVMRKLS